MKDSAANDARDAFVDYLHGQAARVRRPEKPPATLAGWDERLAAVRAGLQRSLGRMPDAPSPLEPEVLGVLQRDGYVIERLTFQSRPGVRVTANLYRPEPVEVPCPAVLSVHGHWPWARIDPHVQARSIGLARLGYVCLAVDAFGAGERAIDPAPGTYHGGLVGASLWPAGVPLMGLQVYDNRRAVDYLVSRPEVDATRLAISGASGGGNQSFYAGATDERLRAVVPVCGIGTFDAYLQTACCVCEVLIGGLQYASAGDLLAMVAPRALLVISATRDTFVFSVGEAAKSIAYARERFRLLGAGDKIRHLAIESGHDYNQPMREALYGWLDRWLRGRGDGSPVAEPKLALEDPQVLRCYADGPARPRAIVTIPEFAQRAGHERLAALPPPPDHPQRWEADSTHMRFLLHDVLSLFPPNVRTAPTASFPSSAGRERLVQCTPEPGLTLRGRLLAPPGAGEAAKGTALLLRPEGMAAPDHPVLTALIEAGWCVVSADLRATGAGKPRTAPVVGVADHTEAEWSLFLGRPLLGQWVCDAIAWLGAIGSQGLPPQPAEPASGPGVRTVVLGVGPFGLVAILAAALMPRTVAAVGLLDPLISFVGAGPWANVPMGLIAPNLLDAGDIGHLAALVAPRRLAIAGGREPNGKTARPERLTESFAFTRAVYEVLDAPGRLTIDAAPELSRILSAWESH